MSYRKVTIELKIKMDLMVDEGVELSEVINELDYTFSDTTDNATIEDYEILDYAIEDSR
jgi:hypothetical protein